MRNMEGIRFVADELPGDPPESALADLARSKPKALFVQFQACRRDPMPTVQRLGVATELWVDLPVSDVEEAMDLAVAAGGRILLRDVAARADLVAELVAIIADSLVLEWRGDAATLELARKEAVPLFSETAVAEIPAGVELWVLEPGDAPWRLRLSRVDGGGEESEPEAEEKAEEEKE